MLIGETTLINQPRRVIIQPLPSIMNIDDYRQMRDNLSSIPDSLPFLTYNTPQPPLLDMDGAGAFGGSNNEVVGIKNFRISAEKDIEGLDAVSNAKQARLVFTHVEF